MPKGKDKKSIEKKKGKNKKASGLRKFILNRTGASKVIDGLENKKK